MVSPLEVRDYSEAELRKLLGRFSHLGMASTTKPQVGNLATYLEQLGAKSIGVEHPYTDRDYLEDYSAYYARCHQEYGRWCARLHFFSAKISQQEVDDAYSFDESAAGTLRRTYLGFIVVKPLPATFIGRTCLKVLGNPSPNTFYYGLQGYDVNIGGLRLRVESLPFQEQDTDVAACATSALWSAFHSVGKKFQRPIPPPVEITKAASALMRQTGRSLPAGDGMTFEQCGDAIRSVGLEPYELQFGRWSERISNRALLRVALSAYMQAGLPAIILGALYTSNVAKKGEEMGFHAATIVGCRFGTSKPRPVEVTRTLFRANQIEALYMHDDGVGPFSEVKIGQNDLTLETKWKNSSRPKDKVNFWPELVLMPLYHKIRVPVVSIIKSITVLDAMLETVRLSLRTTLQHFTSRITWDVRLCEVQDYKSSLFDNKNVDPRFRSKLLAQSLPRYMWVAEARLDATIFELLFDATDLLQATSFVGGVPLNTTACAEIGTALAPMKRSQRLSSYPQCILSAFNWFEPKDFLQGP